MGDLTLDEVTMIIIDWQNSVAARFRDEYGLPPDVAMRLAISACAPGSVFFLDLMDSAPCDEES